MTRPTVETTGSAGADLYAAEDGFIVAGGYAVIRTGYAYDLDKPALVKGRSSLAFRHKVLTYEGLIDADFTGEICVLLHSILPPGNGHTFRWKAGDRIAQLVVLDNVVTGECFEVKAKERQGGFGSTNEPHVDHPQAHVAKDVKYWAIDEKRGSVAGLVPSGTYLRDGSDD